MPRPVVPIAAEVSGTVTSVAVSGNQIVARDDVLFTLGRETYELALANAEAAFAVTLEYANERQAFGRKIADFQVNRFKFADMRTEMDVCQAFVDRCVMVHNEGKLTAEDAAKAKLYATELEDRVTDHCVQLHGGAGYMDEYPISRMYTAARVSRIYAGSSEIMREIIARSIGLDPRAKKTSTKAHAA